MKSRLIIIPLVALLVVSCNQTPAVLDTPTLEIPEKTAAITQVQVQKPANTVTPTISSTPTKTETTPTLSPSPIPTEISWMKIDTLCVEVVPGIPGNLKGTGNIILFGLQGADSSYILNMETGQMIPISRGWQWWEWQVSPNEHRLLFITDVQNQFAIYDLKGNLEKTIVLDPDVFPERWWDDQRLALHRRIDSEINLNTSQFILYNPFTGESRELAADFPDLYSYRLYYTPLDYNPTLRYIVYPYGKDGVGFYLRDVQESTTLASIRSNEFGIGIRPLWSPDGKQVLVSGLLSDVMDFQNIVMELFSIDLNGNIQQLTDVAAHGLRILPLADMRSSSYSWSPDGHKIAFWVKKSDDPLDYLAVLDVRAKLLTEYCLPGFTFGAAPIWSPDSRQLVIHDETTSNSTMIVDIEEYVAFEINGNLYPLWWLRNFPEIWVEESN